MEVRGLTVGELVENFSEVRGCVAQYPESTSRLLYEGMI